MDASKVINGTFGEVWLDESYVGEAIALQAKIDFTKEDIRFPRQMGKDTKTIGFEGKGSLRMNKVNSRMGLKLRSLVKEGKDVRFTIVSKLADPDAYGAEKVVLKNVSFDDLTLADWESAKAGQVESPFTFSDYDFIDSINPV